MSDKKYFIIDFDSTFTQVEALDILGEISLDNNKERDERLQKIKDVTDLGMEGKVSFRQSLVLRIELLAANRQHLEKLIPALKSKVSKSFKRNKEFLKDYADNIYIISNGFKDFIVPIVTDYGIKAENVFANTFEFDTAGNIIGFDTDNVLSSNNGKGKVIEKLKLTGDVSVIGDGYTDYEIKKDGFANKFYAFTENIAREKITAIADHITPSLDEFLYHNKMNTAISYPKNRIKVLLLENVHEGAVKILKEEGYEVETYDAALDEDELIEKIKDVSIIGLRSKTQLTKKVLENANRLLVIGAFCIGTNQIDLETATKKGIAVFNAPFSNTRSVVELAIAQIVLLMRNLPDKMMLMHQGKWDKSAANSFEIRGKKLGIIGYGNIGSQLSILAEGMGLDVYYYDLVDKLSLGNATQCASLDELLEVSDVISIHVDGRPDNKNIIGEEEFKKMKDGVIFINLGRGFVVDIPALSKYLKNGKVRGSAVDVFPKEPKSNQDPFMSELIGMPNTILTPHIGGSTLEAQVNIGQFVPHQIIDYINTGSTTNSVNFPAVRLPAFQNAHRLMHIHQNEAGVLAKINSVLAACEVNVVGQYLKTNESIGYMITDINKQYNKELIKKLKEISGTIWFRVLY